MTREKLKWRTQESERIDAEHGGDQLVVVEISVLEMERRGWIVGPCRVGQPEREEPTGWARPLVIR